MEAVSYLRGAKKKKQTSRNELKYSLNYLQRNFFSASTPRRFRLIPASVCSGCALFVPLGHCVGGQINVPIWTQWFNVGLRCQLATTKEKNAQWRALRIGPADGAYPCTFDAHKPFSAL